MIGACIKENMVDNVIVLDPSQVEELRAALGYDEIIDAAPYGLTIGDLRTPAGWTRNAGGEQMILTLLDPVQYDGYTLAVERAEAAEAQVEVAAEIGANEAATEAMNILTGMVEVE